MNRRWSIYIKKVISLILLRIKTFVSTSFSRYSLVVVIIFTLSANLCGQVVNIEKKRKGNQDGFAGVIKFGFDIVENNKHIVKFKNVIDLQYKKASHVWIFINDIKLMQVDDNKLVNDGFQHLRYNYTFKDSSFLTFEAFTQNQYNTVKQIEKRFLAGAGLRYRIVNTDKMSVYLATLGMYEYEKRSNADKEILETARLTSYVSMSWDILDNLSFKHISYYQPSFKNLNNYRFASESSFNIKITSMLFFKTAINLTLDSHPSEGVNRTFYVLENALQFKF